MEERKSYKLLFSLRNEMRKLIWVLYEKFVVKEQQFYFFLFVKLLNINHPLVYHVCDFPGDGFCYFCQLPDSFYCRLISRKFRPSSNFLSLSLSLDQMEDWNLNENPFMTKITKLMHFYVNSSFRNCYKYQLMDK